MRKLSLGRVLSALFLSALFCASAQGSVNLHINTPAIHEGDVAEFSIVASGTDIEFPKISEVDGVEILEVSNLKTVSTANGGISEQSRTYKLRPTRSITLPAFEIKVDGKVYTTDSAKIKVSSPEASKNGDDFVLEISLDKSELMVGQSAKLSVTFKRKVGANVDRVELEDPNLAGFWIRQFSKTKQDVQGDYLVETIDYLLFAQKSGEYDMAPLVINVGQVNRGSGNDLLLNIFTGGIQWKKVYSNPLKISVKPLPVGVENFGSYAIKASVDKNTTNANEPVNLSLEIDGYGNIDDVKKFKLNLSDALVYSDEPTIKTGFMGDKYSGKFVQKFAIVSDNSYVVPSIEFSYFDENSGKVKKISSDKIPVTVINQTPKIEPKIESLELNPRKVEQIYSQNDYEKWLFAFAGFMVGGALFYLISRVKFGKKVAKFSTISIRIKSAKSDKELFNLLLPFAKDSELIAKTLSNLEQNLYKNQTQSIDKKALIEYFEELES